MPIYMCKDCKFHEPVNPADSDFVVKEKCPKCHSPSYFIMNDSRKPGKTNGVKNNGG